MHSTSSKASKLVPSLVLLAIVGATSAATAYPVKPAWRGDSLSTPNTYLVTTGYHDLNSNELDLGVLRWDATLGDWSRSANEGEEMWTVKEDDPIYGMPLYAPMDGEIVSCWREMVDQQVPGNMPAGNHVTIRSVDQSHIVFVGHLMKSSIPDALCPIATEDVDGDPPDCPLRGPDWTKIKPQTLVSAPLPTVRQGDFLGYVGMSGATGGNPHLHMHAKSLETVNGELCVGPAEPMEFDEAWATMLPGDALPSDDDWVRLSGDVPAYNQSDWMALWPEPSGIQLDTQAVEAATIPAIAITEDATLGTEGVVAYRASNGALKVAEVDIEQATGISIMDTETEAGADRIAVARIGDIAKSAVVAIRNAATYKLQLIPYNILANHTLDRGGILTSANTISDVAITYAPYDSGVVVASIDSGTADLKVKAYGATVTPTDITLTGGDSDTSTENVMNVDIATIFAGRSILESLGLDPFVGVVTAERRANGEGWLRVWEVADDGGFVMLADEIQLLSATSGLPFSVSDIDVSVVGDADERQFVVVSLRHSNGYLYVQSYQVAVDGTLMRMDQWTAGAVDMLASSDGGEYDATVAVRTSGALSLLSFSVDTIGTLGRSGTRDLAALSSSANSIAVDGFWPAEALVTAAIKSNGDLSLGYYHTNYSNAL